MPATPDPSLDGTFGRVTAVSGWVTSYSLAGIRAMTTEPQLALLDRVVEALRGEPRVAAAWLVGSFALGNADAFSDLDVHCLVADEDAESLSRDWLDLVRAVTPVVTMMPFRTGTLGGSVITPEWLHLDVAIHRASTLDVATLAGMAPLFDRTGRLPAGPVPLPPEDRRPHFPHDVVQWFFYLFGSLVVVVGRNEPAWAMNGVITMRDAGLVPLMMAENGTRRIGGNKRLNPFLTPEQREVLRSLPPIAPTIDSVVAAEVAIARDFIPRGRALAARVGAEWPAALEEATVRWVERGIGVTVLG